MIAYNKMANNSAKDKVLKPIKKYFKFSGQCWSFKNPSKAKRILYGLLRVAIGCFALLYFVYAIANFASNMKLYRLSRCFFYYPISTIENAMWEFRWLVTCWMGIVLTRGIWLEMFENNKNISLRDKVNWEKVKHFSWALGAALILMWVASEIAYLYEINFKITRLNALSISIDALVTLVDRILAFPLFCLFCITMYILCCMVEEYRDNIENWGKDGESQLGTDEGTTSNSTSDGNAPEAIQEGDFKTSATEGAEVEEAPEGEFKNSAKKRAAGKGERPTTEQDEDKSENSGTDHGEIKGENLAREQFRQIKAAIRTAGLKFEFYLTVHFLLLVCTVFLGICSCFEQLEVRIAQNSTIDYTMPLPFQIPHYARYVNFFGNLTFDNDYTIGAPATKSASLLTASHIHLGETQGTEAVTGANSTWKADQFDDLRLKWLKRSMTTAWVCMLIKTLESLLLYFLPISLMARLQNRLRRVYEVIEDSNLKEQEAKGLLFDKVEVIRRMCKYVKTAHGLKIYGYTVPTFGAFILAAFTPFIAVVIQMLLSHIHMKKG